MLIADILLIILVLVALIIASLIDLKIREVPDWLNFSLITIALGIRLIYALAFNQWSYFLYGVLGFSSMFILGALIFYTKQWGGGDAKLLMGLGAVFGTKPFFIPSLDNLRFTLPFTDIVFQLPFLAILLINLLFVGAVYGLVWSVFLFLKNRKKVVKEFKRLYLKKHKMRILYLVLGVLTFVPVLFIPIFTIRFMLFIGAFILFTYPYLFLIIKSIENVGMHKYVAPKELTEGDWVAETIKIKGKVICSSKDLGLEKYQIEALKKAKIRKVLIKEGMAFVPAIFLGTVFTLVYSHIIFLFL